MIHQSPYDVGPSAAQASPPGMAPPERQVGGGPVRNNLSELMQALIAKLTDGGGGGGSSSGTVSKGAGFMDASSFMGGFSQDAGKTERIEEGRYAGQAQMGGYDPMKFLQETFNRKVSKYTSEGGGGMTLEMAQKKAALEMGKDVDLMIEIGTGEARAEGGRGDRAGDQPYTTEDMTPKSYGGGVPGARPDATPAEVSGGDTFLAPRDPTMGGPNVGPVGVPGQTIQAGSPGSPGPGLGPATPGPMSNITPSMQYGAPGGGASGPSSSSPHPTQGGGAPGYQAQASNARLQAVVKAMGNDPNQPGGHGPKIGSAPNATTLQEQRQQWLDQIGRQQQR